MERERERNVDGKIVCVGQHMNNNNGVCMSKAALVFDRCRWTYRGGTAAAVGPV